MCGIFGYLSYQVIKDRQSVIEALLTGLRRLEYRGYDSAGLAFDSTIEDNAETVVIKECGNIDKLHKKVEETVGELKLNVDEVQSVNACIAHTRWATHGVPSTVNSHPHKSDANYDFVVVHNGIITNYKALRDFLISEGAEFESDTDTEVIPKLCKYVYDRLSVKVSFGELVSQVIMELDGAFALLFKSRHYPGQLVGCRRGSPLLLGIKSSESFVYSLDADEELSPRRQKMVVGPPSEAGAEFYFASDASAIVEHTKRVIVMEDNDIIHLKDGSYSIYSLAQNANKEDSTLVEERRILQTLEIGVEQIMKGGYDHFMQKEIHEQPDSLIETMRGRVVLKNFQESHAKLEGNGFHVDYESVKTSEGEIPLIKLGGLEHRMNEIVKSRRIIFIACGTSFHACLAARQLVEELTGIPVTLELASDFLDRKCPMFRDDTCVFVSQSGETADTLKALLYAKAEGSLCVGITNTVGSSISRDTDCGIHVNAGCEIGVASTKAYTCQIIVIVMMALKLSEDSVKRRERRSKILHDLLQLPSFVKKTLEVEPVIKELAEELVNEQSLLVFGRGYNYATALEIALKVKEVSLMHSEGILAGELKHGPLALIDETMPAIVVATKDSLREKMWSTIQQLLARKGRLILLTSKDDDDMSEHFSTTKGLRIIKVDTVCDCLQPIINIVPFQLLSYHLTILRGYNVDQPRNLAKAVTVE